MGKNVIPTALLQGEYFHCQPKENGPTVKLHVIPLETEERVNRICVCWARLSSSRCLLRIRDDNNRCEYWRGDGLAGYQIIGPMADHKSTRGWEN